MKSYNVGIIGGTGMVGQRFATLLENHPWFHVKVIAASSRSAGQRYEDAVKGRWAMSVPIPDGLTQNTVPAHLRSVLYTSHRKAPASDLI